MSQKVSIIIPVYNVEDYLKQCLDSVSKQSYHNIEVLLVDDGSTDKSLSICQSYVENDGRFLLIYQGHGGNSMARNNGVAHSTGELITFIDSDDFVDPDYVESLVNQMDRYNSDIAITMYRTFHEDVKQFFVLLGPSPADKEFNGCHNNQEWMQKVEAMPNILAGSMWCKLFKRELFNHVRFPEKVPFCEDAMALWKLELIADKISFENVINYNYRTNRPGSITNKSINSAIYFEFKNIQQRIGVMKTADLDVDYLKDEYRQMMKQLRDNSLKNGHYNLYCQENYKMKILNKYMRRHKS